MELNKNNTTELLVTEIINGIQEKKGTNIAILDLRKIESSVTGFFVICDANSTTQVDAIADSVEDYVREQIGEKPYRIEGKQNAEWILIDYIDVVVHVFLRPVRDFYNLEGLWADADKTEIEDIV